MEARPIGEPRREAEGHVAILVFDRSSLKTHYKLECIADGWVADSSEFNEFWRAENDEFEEHVFARDVEIAPHLIAMISTPIASLSHKQRAVNRAMELRFDEETADCGCGVRWRTCSDCRAEAADRKAEQLERAYPGISTLWRDSGP
jgi:hypothetical protein